MKEFLKAVPLEEAIGKKLIGYCASEYLDEYLLLSFDDGTFCQLKAENDDEWGSKIVNDLSIWPSCYKKSDLIELGIDEVLIDQWIADQEKKKVQDHKESRRKLYEELKQEFGA